jgi:hypothetical protein
MELNNENISIAQSIYEKLITNLQRFETNLEKFTEHTHEKINLLEFQLYNNKQYIDTLNNYEKNNVYKIIFSIILGIENNLNNDKIELGETYYDNNKELLDKIKKVIPIDTNLSISNTYAVL